ncbi:MAG: SMC-Scp complex subunit ScpB [Bryobacterales bacterium]|nr:SMC-Scp complex subunit ScpB [Bryobacterales bacterium]
MEDLETSAPDRALETESVGADSERQPEETAAGDLAPEQFLIGGDSAAAPDPNTELRAVLEAIVYITDEPLSSQQIASALGQPQEKIEALLEELAERYARPEHGLMFRQVAGGYKITTKPEHHEAVRAFVKNLKPPLKLSLPALETLAVVAYKQPITAPEIMEIRGVQGAGVLKTLLDRKLITTAGRKNVIGRPILYRTTREFLVQFGLKDLSELPTLKEFEELRRLAFSDSDEAELQSGEPQPQPQPGEEPQLQPGEETPAAPDSGTEAADQEPEKTADG